MDLAHLIRHPEELNSETLHQLRELVACFPYYQAARLLFLQNLFLLHDPTFDQELRRAALFLPNRRLLFNMVHGRQYEFHLRKKKETPPPPPTPRPTIALGDRTSSLISTFLRDTNAIPTPKDKPPTFPITASPSSDYMSYLFQTQGIEDKPADGFDLLGLPTGSDRQDADTDATDTDTTTLAPTTGSDNNRMVDLITSFIDKGKNNERLQLDHSKTVDAPESIEGDSDNEKVAPEAACFTETLARIYIQQGKYERAIEIFTKLHLNNRKKSAYFADQIRFLQKLVINNKH